nr:GPI mannosyltransferase 4-like isoform X1 [Ciona intestinalis]XP_009862198.1 GPI mannosyltransferase 4-like isoform X2 [Ciona intestinalis]|eukprot:XP_002125899.1 GPI mannosyltransferase 4-like isoform X1 [Ciona intestinalis]
MENLWLKMIWMHCAALRYMLCILPQTGYIFPDEFFQSPEIMAGDILDIASFKTWEWNDSQPARTIIFPLISSGIPYLVLKYLAGIFGHQNVITPYTMLLAPRLWMTTLSFIVDALIYRLAVKCYNGNAVNANVAVNLFATSYVCFAYCTRTFSNSVDLIFLAILLNLVAEPIGKEHNVKNLLDINIKGYFIATIIFTSFHIRPSSMSFAAFPVIMWVFQNVSLSNNKAVFKSIIDTFLRVFSLYPAALVCSVTFAVCDGLYFDQNAVMRFPWDNLNIENLIIWFKSLPSTSLNNLKYNLNSSMLEQHGVHPLYTHSLVNMQLLFGPLTVLMLKSIYSTITGAHGNKKLLYLLIGTLFSTVFILSLIPHQEPRFILSVTVPIVILCAPYFHPLKERKALVSLWLLFNMAGFAFFGVIHQGGVLPAVEYIHSVAKAHQETTGNNGVQFVFYKTYMPPYHLTAWPSHSFNYEMFPKGNPEIVLNILDLAGSSPQLLKTYLRSINTRVLRTYLVAPNSLPCSLTNQLHEEFKMQIAYQYFPHFSSENLPFSPERCKYVHDKTSSPLSLVLEKMSLNIYSIESKLPILPDSDTPIKSFGNSHIKSESIVQYTVTHPKINTSKL